MPTLADIYSAADSFKRRLADAASNPSGSLQQMLGYANDRARNFNDLQQQSLAETRQGGFANQGPATQELNQAYAEGLQPVGMTVFHGSPYKFSAFDASKIGSGEGAQAFGHGIYVAQNPSIAKEYQEKLSSTSGAKRLLSNANNDMDAAITEAQRKVNHYQNLIENGGGGMMDKAKHFLQMSQKNLDDLMAQKQGLPENTGALYKIDLPDEHIERMLDWDKPFANQAKDVKEALKKSGIYKQYKANQSDFSSPQQTRGTNMRGENILAFIEHTQGGPEKAAQFLSDLGIPGIKYLDASSRDIRKGTRNMVVFPGNEHILNIQDMNGKPIK